MSQWRVQGRPLSSTVDELRTAMAGPQPHTRVVAPSTASVLVRNRPLGFEAPLHAGGSIGLAVAAVPYLWVLFDLWNGSFDLLRTAESNGYASNFYDLQARAIFHGHLYAPNGAFGGEHSCMRAISTPILDCSPLCFACRCWP